jgi:hypothetical protein
LPILSVGWFLNPAQLLIVKFSLLLSSNYE